MSKYRRIFIADHYLFITVVTKKRNPILIDNIELLRDSFKIVKKKYSFEIYAIVVMPDHFHMILYPQKANEFPKIIAAIKWHFSRRLDPIYELMSESSLKRREKGIWQRRYYEHRIRDEKELRVYLDYIHYNPVKHGHVKIPADWEYSSYKKFVKNGYHIDENSLKQIENID